jgi:flagellar hook-basal body complex protein FliE
MGYINQSKSFQQFTKYMEQENYIDKPKDKITIAVMKDLKLRSDRGYIKYGTYLHQNDHQNMLQHMYEEALDFSQYLKKEITTLNTIQDLAKQYSDDIELGKAIRLKYGKS